MSDVHANTPKPVGLRGYLMTWLSLVALVALTVASAYFNLGGFNLFCSIAIAFAKTLIVLAFCMNLRRESATMRLFAAAGFFWLALLITLALGDFLTR